MNSVNDSSIQTHDFGSVTVISKVFVSCFISRATKAQNSLIILFYKIICLLFITNSKMYSSTM